jgi:23S rRNA pseudouridine1911/1915/1917 synthase
MAETMSPYIVDETKDYAVVFKPPRLHCAPLQDGSPHSGGDTLFDWYAALFPPVADIVGRKRGEGGLLDRLDFETQGLTLFARNQSFADNLLAQQRNGTFIKEYSALCVESARPDSTFPPLPAGLPPRNANGSLSSGFAIESFFRPYGPGRKQVRPVIETRAGGAGALALHHETAKDRLARGGCYRTEVFRADELPRRRWHALILRLARGFRHQIRCHLAWIGFPVANDPLYGDSSHNSGLMYNSGSGLPHGDDGSFLALRACALAFIDTRSGKVTECRIECGEWCFPLF